jgi:hypothetical protein
MKHVPRVLVGVVVITALAVPVLAQRPEPEVVATVDGDPVYRVLAPDAIRAIDEPEFLTGEAADAQMQADEPVLGVEIDGEARAYSLWHLDTHEIVNDTVAGTAIAATW